ncbi:hypothetical protein C8Q75DRAFT_805820 [Abortiporus biennis]|nr:hypothetical protein C8Q75DRAFT_805820 [Abortiporus biennis]
MASIKQNPANAGLLALPKLDNTLGAVFIGLLVTSVLYGITCVQTYVYYMGTGKRDKLLLHGAGFGRSAIGLLDASHVPLCYHKLLQPACAHFCSLDGIGVYNSPASDVPLTYNASCHDLLKAFNVPTNVNDVLTRTIFIYRIWRLSRSLSLAVGLMIMNFVCGAFGLVMTAKIHQLGSFEKLPGIEWLIYCVFGSIAFTDTSIAASLCIILWRMQTGFTKTDTQLQKLMKYSIHTGALTSLIAVIALISYGSMPHNFVYIGVYTTLPKFYFNALLATLNARDSIRSAGQNSSAITSIPLGKVRVSTSQGTQESEATSTNKSQLEFKPVNILVTSDTAVYMDSAKHFDGSVV